MATARRFEAVVFDLDGVLIDTEQTLYEVWQEIFAEFGAAFTRGEWQVLIGTTDGESPYSWLGRRASRPVPPLEELRAFVRAREIAAIEHLQSMPGALDWIDEAEELGLGLAVASSSSLDWVEARLKQIDLIGRFSAVICPTSELRAKPAPDVYLAAAAALGVQPARALAIEDSMNGVAAARAAGYACIAVPNALTIDMDLSGAHMCLSSLAEASINETIARLSEASRPLGFPLGAGRAAMRKSSVVNEEASRTGTRRVGPPPLLGLRPRFMERVMDVAQEDERIRALALWGSLARGDADEWSGVDFVATVADDSIAEFLDELSSEESRYGRSLVTLRMPQQGVEGGGFLSVTYLRAGFPLPVNWYVCPLSLGVPIGDTKPFFARDGWPSSGRSLAQLLRERPSQQSFSPPHWDQVVSMIPIQVKEVARGRPEAVVVDGEPMHDRRDAYAALDRQISELPATHADVKFALYGLLGTARQLR